jgi:hypothetical protein
MERIEGDFSTEETVFVQFHKRKKNISKGILLNNVYSSGYVFSV